MALIKASRETPSYHTAKKLDLGVFKRSESGLDAAIEDDVRDCCAPDKAKGSNKGVRGCCGRIVGFGQYCLDREELGRQRGADAITRENSESSPGNGNCGGRQHREYSA